MNKLFAFLVTTACLISKGVPDPIEESVCRIGNRITNQTTVSIHSKKDVSNEWVTTISSYTEGSQNGTNLNVTRRIIGCGRKDVIHVKVIIGGSFNYPVNILDGQTLLFHPKGGKNVVVSQDRRTVFRINIEEMGKYAGIVTNRRLNDNELFEVKLDRIVGTYAENIAIGVTPISPEDMEYPEWMKYSAIMVYGNTAYRNGTRITSNYGSNLNSLKAGQRLGVMKKDNGNMHVYVDGVDKGVAASGIAYPVYGVIDLYHKAAQATII